MEVASTLWDRAISNAQMVIAPYAFIDTQELIFFWQEAQLRVTDQLKMREDLNELISQHHHRRRIQKGRWIQRVQKSIDFDVNVVAPGVWEESQRQSNGNDKFLQLYGVDTPEEWHREIVQEMESWRKDHQKLFCDFRYFHALPLDVQKKALLDDMGIVLLTQLRDITKSATIWEWPDALQMVPVDPTNKAKMTPDEATRSYVHFYEVDEIKMVESRITVPDTEQEFVGTIFKMLNAVDVRIFSYCLSLRDKHFYTTHVLTVNIGDIVRAIYRTDGQKNFIAVKESLLKMQNLNIIVRDKKGQAFTLKLLDSVRIFISGNQEMARLVVDADIVNQYVRNQTTNLYRESISSLDNEAAKVVVFALQKERIRRMLEGESLTFHATIQYFRGILYFSTKRKKENRDMVERALQRLVEHQLVLRHVERHDDLFVIEFLPIDKNEAIDLVKQELPPLIK